MERSRKPELVAEWHDTLKGSSLVVIARQDGLTVSEINALRGKMRAAGATFKVAKNSLVRLALKDTAHEALIQHFKGVVTVATSVDPIAAAKAADGFANDNKRYTILAGSLNGRVLSQAEIKALAALPSLDALRSTLIGLIQAPASKIARVVSAPAAQLARVVQAYAQKS